METIQTHKSTCTNNLQKNDATVRVPEVSSTIGWIAVRRAGLSLP